MVATYIVRRKDISGPSKVTDELYSLLPMCCHMTCAGKIKSYQFQIQLQVFVKSISRLDITHIRSRCEATRQRFSFLKNLNFLIYFLSKSIWWYSLLQPQGLGMNHHYTTHSNSPLHSASLPHSRYHITIVVLDTTPLHTTSLH